MASIRAHLTLDLGPLMENMKEINTFTEEILLEQAKVHETNLEAGVQCCGLPFCASCRTVVLLQNDLDVERADMAMSKMADGTRVFLPKRTVEEASTLGWPAGLYKETFEYEGKIYTFDKKVVERGELVSWNYKSKDGHEFVVMND